MLNRVVAVALTVFALSGCVKRQNSHADSWLQPQTFIHKIVLDEVHTLVNDAYVVILAEQWAAIDSVERRTKFMKENFQGCRLEEYADSIEIFYPAYFEAHKVGDELLRPYSDTVRGVVYREEYPDAALSVDVGAVRRYGSLTLVTLGEGRYNVECSATHGVPLLAEMYHRPDFNGTKDLFVLSSALRAGSYDGLELKYSLDEFMLQMPNRFRLPYYLGGEYWGSLRTMYSISTAIFNGRIDMSAQTSSMSVPDRFLVEYTHSGSYNIVEK